ncbi:protein bicaudal D-like [Limulus polyphemus]|uniref:Protein bicaudal D-like n=1 Tax=Limulus polyphemus TaxID=6850 RepID=A0ABM1TDT3_LIMPO|nr:protein bicaudal D-like [Limulus polyphemus]
MGDFKKLISELTTERDSLKDELERLHRELAQTSHEKIQSAQYGLVLLDEKEALQQRCEDLEALFDATKHELDCLKEALAKSQTSQKVSATTGIEQEENLLKETAHKEASFTSTLQELEREIKQVKQELARVEAERDRIHQDYLDLSKQIEVSEWEKKNLKLELKEIKLREGRLLIDNNELEDENISLQKQVSLLRSSQRVETVGSQHRVARTVGSQHRVARTVGSQHRVARTVGSQHRVARTVGSQHRIARTVGSQHGVARTVGSQHGVARTVGSQHRVARTVGSQHRVARTVIGQHNEDT